MYGRRGESYRKEENERGGRRAYRKRDNRQSPRETGKVEEERAQSQKKKRSRGGKYGKTAPERRRPTTKGGMGKSSTERSRRPRKEKSHITSRRPKQVYAGKQRRGKRTPFMTGARHQRLGETPLHPLQPRKLDREQGNNTRGLGRSLSEREGRIGEECENGPKIPSIR